MRMFGQGIVALGVGAALIFSAALAFADGSKGSGAIVTKSIGTYGPASGPATEGELLTCADDEGFSPISQTFYYIRGICDNRESHGLPACDGRYVGYGEECSRDEDGYTEASGFVISRVTDGKFRICFSDPALGEADCASETPAAEVIAMGTTQSHTNHVVGTEILLGVGETILDRDFRRFRWEADGRRHDWRRKVGKVTVVHSQAQINGGRCPADEACGVSSTGVEADGHGR